MTKHDEYAASVYGGDDVPDDAHALNKEAIDLVTELSEQVDKRVKAAKNDADHAKVYKLDAKTTRRVERVTTEIDALPDTVLDTVSFPFVAQSLRTRQAQLREYLATSEASQ